MSSDIIFVVFGGTGDLAKRKLAPAFADMLFRGVIDKNSTFIGISRGNFSSSTYKKLLIDSVFGKEKKHLSKSNIHFYQGDASSPDSLGNLSKFISSLNKPSARLVLYLATSHSLFSLILQHIKKQGLAKNAIILFEKPFGSNFSSAKALESELEGVFSENHIFRVDHYLAKEKMRDFSGLIVPPSEISSLEIFSDESLGVGERLGYYNSEGAIKDMVQNHLIQVLSRVIAGGCKANLVHECKMQSLHSLKFNANAKNILGQYESYTKEAKIKGISDSKTETFVRLHFSSSLKDWKGVDIILQTGKKLDKKEAKIITHLKNGKKHEIDIGASTTHDYAVLLEDALHGKISLFPSSEEILESWRIVEEIDRNKIKSVVYKDGEKAESII